MTMRKFDKKAISRFAAAVAQAEEEFSDMVAEVNVYYDERSDEWRESEKGDAYQSAIGSLEDILDTIQQLNSDIQDLEDEIENN